MTHNELLAEVDQWLTGSQAAGVGNNRAIKFLKVFRAVVELHRSFQIDREGNYNCQECEWEYPCSTIQAIEKELG